VRGKDPSGLRRLLQLGTHRVGVGDAPVLLLDRDHDDPDEVLRAQGELGYSGIVVEFDGHTAPFG
jgi:hypothetical protein